MQKIVTMLLAASVPTVLLGQSYTIRQITPFVAIEPREISNSGDICGYTTLPSGLDRAAKWHDGALIELGGYPGFSSYANGINADGTAVGEAGGHAARWTNDGVFTDLGYLGTSWGSSYATSINQAGTIAGSSEIDETTGMDRDERAFLYRNGQMMDIGSLNPSGHTYANDVNIHDEVVGSCVNEKFQNATAFVWSMALGMRPLSTFSYSLANAINDSGEIIGQVAIPGDSQICVWENGNEVLLGRGRAFDLNNIGEIVGVTQSSQGSFGTIWRNFVPIRLNDLIQGSGWNVVEPISINDLGQIVARAYPTGSSNDAWVLLTPVPEPATIAVLGVLVILFRKPKTQN